MWGMAIAEPVTSENKLRGGYYTPSPIADALSRWAITPATRRVLEPSAGDGSFVRSAACRLSPEGEIQAVELFSSEADKIREIGDPRIRVVTGDVFAWYFKNRASFDVILGNPPFIRYQNFPEAHRQTGFALMQGAGLRPNRLTNAWVPFVVLAAEALRPGGRLAMVLPAELLQVSYAAQLREYLARTFKRLTVITFRRLVFKGIQQETVLLAGVRGSGTAKMGFVELDSLEELSQPVLRSAPTVIADLDHVTEKWTQYYLSPLELGLIREIETGGGFPLLGELAEVDVGIVTGRNEFFVMTASEADTRDVRNECLPMVGRSQQIPGLVFRTEDWDELLAADSRCLLLQLSDVDRSNLTEAAQSYVKYGEQQRFHEGFKCRIRLPNWWNVPSAWSPDAFLLRQIHEGPRIISNEAGATCTDTIHRVRVRPGVDASQLAAASMNSLTCAFSEIRGRSYGGGVLELEPTEAEGLPFPKLDHNLPLEEVDSWARKKPFDEVVDEVDRWALSNIGLEKKEIRRLNAIWRKLSGRRMQRR